MIKYCPIMLLLLCISASLPACTAEAPDSSNASSVILLIGDGMGFPHITAARMDKAGYNLTAYADTDLYMDRMEQTGYVTTYSANSFVTDSAPASTAMATGEKTNNGVIGQDSTAMEGERDGVNLTTILEMAEDAGLATGIITTTRITHATPAAFYAHVDDRDNESEIADQLLYSDTEVILGGGLKFFVGRNDTDPLSAMGKRDDDRNLLEDFASRGYLVVYNRSALMALDATDANSTDRVLGLFNTDHMMYDLERGGSGEPSLEEMVSKALEILSGDEDGFFLMVEGGRIDHASHARNLTNTIGETLAFDNAVKAALDFAAERNDTLVIVTADHECGGLTLQPADLETYEAGVVVPVFASGTVKADGDWNLTAGEEATHTAVDVPIMASGPGDGMVSRGRIDNTEIFNIMAEAMEL